MQKINWIQDLFRHMEWADALVWQSVFKLEKRDDEPRLVQLFYHIHSVQDVFLQVWENQPLMVAEPSSFADLNAISQWGSECHKRVKAFLDKLDENTLDQMTILPWAAQEQVEKNLGRPAEPTTLAETMLQVTSHSTYHRGQVNAILSKLGGVPPLVDYIAWIWVGKPKSCWPEAVGA